MIPKDFKPNPPRKLPIEIDPTEYAALTVVVKAMLAMMAHLNERGQAGSGRTLINQFSGACQDAILNGTIDVGLHDADTFKRKTMEHVNHILQSITLPNDRGRPDN